MVIRYFIIYVSLLYGFFFSFLVLTFFWLLVFFLLIMGMQWCFMHTALSFRSDWVCFSEGEIKKEAIPVCARY